LTDKLADSGSGSEAVPRRHVQRCALQVTPCVILAPPRHAEATATGMLQPRPLHGSTKVSTKTVRTSTGSAATSSAARDSPAASRVAAPAVGRGDAEQVSAARDGKNSPPRGSHQHTPRARARRQQHGICCFPAPAALQSSPTQSSRRTSSGGSGGGLDRHTLLLRTSSHRLGGCAAAAARRQGGRPEAEDNWSGQARHGSVERSEMWHTC